MRRHADIVEILEQELADAIVENALAVDHLMFLGVESGGVVLEVLDECARLGSLEKDFRLSLIDAATAVHRDIPWFEKIHGKDGSPLSRRAEPMTGMCTAAPTCFGAAPPARRGLNLSDWGSRHNVGVIEAHSNVHGHARPLPRSPPPPLSQPPSPMLVLP